MNSENKKWFDMMCEWNADEYLGDKIQCDEPNMKYLLDECHVSKDDFNKYDETKDYRAMMLSMYFMADILGHYGDRDREFISSGDDEYKTIAFAMRRIFVRNDREEHRSGHIDPSDYVLTRNRFGIKYPMALDTYPFHFEA